MYVEHVLGVEGAQANGPEDRDYDVIEDPNAAMAFLESRPMAKIVIVIDTHSVENGCFAYSDDEGGSVKACSLLEVRISRPRFYCRLGLTPTLDPSGLSPRWSIPYVCVQRKEHPTPPAQMPDRQHRMWMVDICGWCPQRAAQGVGHNGAHIPCSQLIVRPL